MLFVYFKIRVQTEDTHILHLSPLYTSHTVGAKNRYISTFHTFLGIVNTEQNKTQNYTLVIQNIYMYI